MSETADAVIVGGGVIGTSIAYHLARRQFGRIVLLERDSLASGSTGHSVATIDSFTLQAQSAELYAQSTRFFQNCAEILGSDCGFIETGLIVLGGPEHEKQLAAAVQHMQAFDLGLTLLPLDELASLQPQISLEGVTTASFAPRAGYADPSLTTNAFATAAKNLGVAVHLGRTVTKLNLKAGRLIGVDTNSGPIESSIVIVAAGPWSSDLLNSAGINLPLTVVRHPVAALRRPPGFGPAHPALLDLILGIYARPETGGLTLLGSLEPQIGHDPINPNDGPGFVQDDYIMWVMERMVYRYPLLGTAELLKGWSGLMTLSPDWQPVLGQWLEIQELYGAAGFSGLGFQISPAVGDMLSGLITGDPTAARILAPFTPLRFTSGNLLQTYRTDFSHKFFE